MTKFNLSLFPGILRTWEEKNNNNNKKKTSPDCLPFTPSNQESTRSGHQGRVMYFVIEFCEGGDLFDRWDCPPYADVEGKNARSKMWDESFCKYHITLSQKVINHNSLPYCLVSFPMASPLQLHLQICINLQNKMVIGKQGSLNYLFWGDQKMQM